MQQLHFRRHFILLLLSVIWIFPSCKLQKTGWEKTITQAEMDSFHLKAVNEFPEYDNITAILSLLKDLDLVFVKRGVNSVENIDKYTGNEMLIATNIGVYLTDIGYMWSYEEIDEALKYNIFVFSLAEQLGLNMEFLEAFFERYDREDTEPDSILFYIERDLSDAINHFPSEKRNEYFSAVLTGSFIEKLHLIYLLIEQCPEISNPPVFSNENIQRLVWIASGQVRALEDLNKKIEEFGVSGEKLLYHEDLCRLDSVMKQKAFLNDSVIVNAATITEDPGFIEVFNEISRIRNLITIQDAQVVE